ncbi:LysR family transcriptional regulator [Hahella sp. KA22]|uniref:LysR family transcriptional regulator n=1 Tax=Hahella sp. KA22 TaxID=1628392 RepID=UPI000FDEC044|nr:LysR family transcriptional regulator [Hahella sp. KA22]AZZ89835.1 LysR family transcriptional regulator [Hahella sp. KA22]QAY53204.1 LysR family transcriptional regulator [Hahella sp. KA22]
MPKSTLEQWRMLHAVVAHGGFAQAAEMVHKSQSTVHHAVHKLEEMLGVQILQVQGRKATLTEAGKLLLRRSENLLQQAEQLESVASGLAQGIEAHIQIAVEIIYPQEALYCALAEFSEQYPNTRIEIIETVLSGAEDLLKQGVCDLVITPFVPQGFIGDLITNIPFTPVANPEHPLHQLNRTLNKDDLARHRQIVIRDSGVVRRNSGWLGAEQRWTVTHMSTSVNMVKRGLGFTWLPVSWVDADIQSGALRALPLQEGGDREVPLYLVYGDMDRQGPATLYLGNQLLRRGREWTRFPE